MEDQNEPFVVQFPLDNAEAVALTQSDIDRCLEGEYLNDSIIDFWMK